MEDVLGMRTTEMIVLDSGADGRRLGDVATTRPTTSPSPHDHYGAHGRFHHATWAVDSKEEVLRAADIFLENGVHIETGPHKHAVQQTFFLYVYEPGGNRVEVDNAGARLMLAPDWQPIVWTETERKKGQAWGLKTIETFHTYGTPPIEQYTGPRSSGSRAGAGPVHARPAVADHRRAMQTAIPCTMMRGGTSKGAYFLASDLPADAAQRDRVLLAVMGSPDPRQIDGIGGADPLTSKVGDRVAVGAPRHRRGLSVLSGVGGQGRGLDAQNCGNILAGVAPFAIERGLVRGCDPVTKVRIFMVNTSQTVVATVQTPGGQPQLRRRRARIDGVPGHGGADSARASPTRPARPAARCCRPAARWTSSTACAVTCIDNGMPVVVMRADDLGRTGYETRDALDADTELKARIEAIRLEAGPMMNLGDVTEQDRAEDDPGGAAARGRRRSRRARSSRIARHATIGVFAALSVATACLLPGEPGARHRAAFPTGATQADAGRAPDRRQPGVDDDRGAATARRS